MPGRCFLALTLPRTTTESLERAGAAFLERAPEWAGEKWVAPELLHVTLEFLGSLPDDDVDMLVNRMGRALSGVPAFEFTLGPLEAVPSRRRATMLWTPVCDPSSQAASLRATLLEAIERTDPSPRPYRPHITLVRARRPRIAPPDALAAASHAMTAEGKEADRAVSVATVTLFSSTLSSAGPRYREMARIPLAR